MASALTDERVRRDVDVLAHAGLDVATFLAEVHDSLRRAVPSCAGCVATIDPASLLMTGTFKFGDLADRHEHDREWGLVEYGQPEPSSFSELAVAGIPAAGVHQMTGGELQRSPRLHEFVHPNLGYTDELRLLARSDGRVWGGLALFRDHPARPFSAEDVRFASSLSSLFASGLRTGLLSRLAAAPAPTYLSGPAVIIVDSEDRVSQVSAGAQARLDELRSDRDAPTPTAVLGSLIGAARRYAAGQTNVLAHSRVRLGSGQWVVLHASPLSGPAGSTGNVVITIEEARPPEIVPLVVAAFGLTRRERDVVQLVLQGLETRQIAVTLHLSGYTVQDHLKSVFDKANVCSRRELVTRVFFDQYVPRFGGELGPSGWFISD